MLLNEILISFITASMLVIIMPGPDIIFVLVQSMTHGKRQGVALAGGFAAGNIVHTSLVAFGVSAIIKNSPDIFFIIKLLGACYLLYLAFISFRSKDAINLDRKTVKSDNFKLFKQGLLLNVLNPKVSIFFLAFFPGFVYSDTQSTVAQFYVLGLIFMLMAFIIFSLVAMLSGSFTEFIKRHPKLNNRIKGFKILVFIGIAIFILFQ